MSGLNFTHLSWKCLISMIISSGIVQPEPWWAVFKRSHCLKQIQTTTTKKKNTPKSVFNNTFFKISRDFRACIGLREGFWKRTAPGKIGPHRQGCVCVWEEMTQQPRFFNRIQAVIKAQSRVTCWPMLADRKEMQKVEQRPCQAEVSIKSPSQPLDWEELDWDHVFDEMKPLTRPYRRFISGNGAIIKRSCGLRNQKYTLRTHTHLERLMSSRVLEPEEQIQTLIWGFSSGLYWYFVSYFLIFSPLIQLFFFFQVFLFILWGLFFPDSFHPSPHSRNLGNFFKKNSLEFHIFPNWAVSQIIIIIKIFCYYI